MVVSIGALALLQYAVAYDYLPIPGAKVNIKGSLILQERY
jgi:hypothetical protein